MADHPTEGNMLTIDDKMEIIKRSKREVSAGDIRKLNSIILTLEYMAIVTYPLQLFLISKKPG